MSVAFVAIGPTTGSGSGDPLEVDVETILALVQAMPTTINTALENYRSNGVASTNDMAIAMADAEQAATLADATLTAVQALPTVADIDDELTAQHGAGDWIDSGGDATLANQELILDNLDTYITQALATVNGTTGTIVGFPSSLTIGDSYTDEGNNAIHVFIRDENDDPILSVGDFEFTDPDFAPELIITNSGNVGRVVATVTYVDPGAPESYLKIELPSSQTHRAVPGVAKMQCVLKWDNCQKTIATQAVTWVARL